MTADEARRRLACYQASGPVDWTSSEGCAIIPERGEAHLSEELNG